MKQMVGRGLAGALALCVAIVSTGEAKAQQIPCDSGDYLVVRGDTLGTIAARAYGDRRRYRDVYRHNVDRIGPDFNIIEVDTPLRIPCDPSQDPDATAETETTVASSGSQVVVTRPSGQRNRVVIAFSKAAAPRYILNVGIIDPFLRNIERVTQGRVTFKAPAGVDAGPRAQLDLVRGGKADGAYIFNGYLAETHPLVQLTMNPLIGGTARQTATALWRVHDKHFRKAGTFDEVHLLGFVAAPPAQIWRTSDEAPAGSDPLGGQNAWKVPYFEGLYTQGAQAFRAENSQQIADLGKTSQIFAMAHEAARAAGLWTKARSVLEIEGGLYVPTFSIFLSKEKWNQISPEDQEAIQQLSGEALALRSAVWDEFNRGHRAVMQQQGLKILVPEVEILAELQDRARVNWEAWIARADAKGVAGYEALEAYFREIELLKQQYPN